MHNTISIKKLSFIDVKNLKARSLELKIIDGVDSVFPTMKVADLGMNGNAFVFVQISKEVAEKIWGAMDMSTTAEESAYKDVMNSDNLKLQLLVYKSGGFFSSKYFVNGFISYETLQVQFGSVASKSIKGIINRVHMLITRGVPFEQSTEIALSKIE
ncbi:hypothetical protein [uncultured Psychromonas sp.]|uniref:hypothetical protein n=1 Tax=uncultured Psychromonas sp. TaxID=173974 RepID=UPI002603CB8E|nr:hypothetical protein [uncultured Psychromonas sp.]